NYSIVYDRTEDITSSPLGRFIIIKPYKTVMKLKKIIRNCWHYLQSCGLLVSPSEFSMYRTGLTDSGVNRCCECGKMLNVVDGAPHDSILPLNELIRWVHSETSFFTAPDRDVIQNHLKFIYGHNELYKKLWKDVDLDQTGSTCRTGRTCCADVIQSLPVLTKKIFYENSPPKKNSIITESLLEAPLIFASGGSTGNPKFSYFTDSEFNTIASALADNYILNGIIKSDKIANLFMAGFLWSSFICVDRAINIIGATNIPIGGQTEIDTIIKYLEIFKPTVIMGLPSQLVEIARIMQKRKIELNVRTVFYAGEQMNDSIMSQLQNSWNVSNFKSAGYASVDAGPIGYQCKEQDKGIHHLYSNMQIIEILEFDSDKKVSDGETGEITITNIFRKLMPFIRYRTGDQGYILKDQKCLCGRNDKVFKLIGRCDDRLLAGGARMNIHEIEPLILKYKLLTSAYQFQVSIKNSNDHLKLLLETDNINEAEKITDRFISEFMEIFKDFAFSVEKKWIEPLELEFLTPNEIKRVERTGKLKLIDDQRIL
ncbi:AMP-binding protein, partial [bacterium]|nr:AMP-binding protein [bacterium]